MMEPFVRRPVYSVGHIKKLCGVSQSAVHKWMDEGKLKGFRLPSQRPQRRFWHEDLVTFLSQEGMRQLLEQVTGTQGLLLVITSGPALPFQLKNLGALVNYTDSFFRAGRMVQECSPTGVLFDLALGRSAAVHAATQMRIEAERPSLLAVTYDDEDAQDSTLGVFDGRFRSPVDCQALAFTLGMAVQ